MRPYQPDDYWRIRAFLRAAYLRNDRRELSWSLLRWDYWRWHIHENIFEFDLPGVVFVWERRGEIIAVLNPDSPGEAFFQIHPDWDSPALQSEMLAAAEEHLARTGAEGARRLTVWAPASDLVRQQLLAERGYARHDGAEHLRRRPLDGPVQDVPVAPGYCVRALGDETELPARSWLSWKAFHPDEPDDRYQGWTWYRNVQRVPLYRRDLDLVAAAPDGSLAAFSTVWLDDVTRSAVFEPVGTHPDHQRRGLGKAVMAEGLRRAQRLGATLASVSSYSPAAHALYASAGFTDVELSEPWQRAW
jgi:GNAT superfamily N-acetyltransferase